MDTSLDHELTALLNRHSAENASNTPDFILAQFLLACLVAWNAAVRRRDEWYGIAPRPGADSMAARLAAAEKVVKAVQQIRDVYGWLPAIIANTLKAYDESTTGPAATKEG